jgi:hypothetical protein
MRSRAELLEAQSLFAAGRNDCEISRLTGIPRRTILDWRRGRGLARRPSAAGAKRCDHDFSTLPTSAYSYLLGLYLGDGWLSAGPRGVWRMRIILDSAYPGIVNECAASLETIMPGKAAYRQTRSGQRTVEVQMWSKHWICLFPQHGPGRKHERRIALEAWQAEIVSKAPKELLRGLIHSDGTRIIATEVQGGRIRRAPRYSFSNRSDDIRRIFCLACDAVGVQWTRPSKYQIAIYRLESVARLDEFVGPKA